MSRTASLFLLFIAPALSLVLGLLGLETLKDNLLGWALLAVGVGYPAGAITSYCIRKIPFWQTDGKVIHEEKGDKSFWAILPGMLLAFFVPPLEYMYMAASLPRSAGVQIAGLALLLCGTALGIWVRHAIKGLYSGHVQVTSDQTLVTTSPYRWVRHPAYAGFVLATLGIALGYGSVIGLAAIGLLLLPALAHRVRVEEFLLEKRFGEQYRAYQHRVRKLIPGLW